MPKRTAMSLPSLKLNAMEETPLLCPPAPTPRYRNLCVHYIWFGRPIPTPYLNNIVGCVNNLRTLLPQTVELFFWTNEASIGLLTTLCKKVLCGFPISFHPIEQIYRLIESPVIRGFVENMVQKRRFVNWGMISDIFRMFILVLSFKPDSVNLYLDTDETFCADRSLSVDHFRERPKYGIKVQLSFFRDEVIEINNNVIFADPSSDCLKRMFLHYVESLERNESRRNQMTELLNKVEEVHLITDAQRVHLLDLTVDLTGPTAMLSSIAFGLSGTSKIPGHVISDMSLPTFLHKAGVSEGTFVKTIGDEE